MSTLFAARGAVLAASAPRVAGPRGSISVRRVSAANAKPSCRRRLVRVAASPETSTVEETSASARFDPPWSEPGYRGAVVSAMSPAKQAASVAAVWGGIAAVTALACGAVGPFIAHAFPGYMAWSRGLWPALGLTYVAAGAAHFALPKGFEDMYPHQGAWGFWYLPGSPDFHVKWTGVAEILGGLGMASALVTDDTPLSRVSALGLFILTLAVTPANTYMWSHNAPGPLPENADDSMLSMEKEAHLARAALQVLLLSVTWGMAHPP
jgi:uncharacterized membrane protein